MNTWCITASPSVDQLRGSRSACCLLPFALLVMPCFGKSWRVSFTKEGWGRKPNSGWACPSCWPATSSCAMCWSNPALPGTLFLQDLQQRSRVRVLALPLVAIAAAGQGIWRVLVFRQYPGLFPGEPDRIAGVWYLSQIVLMLTAFFLSWKVFAHHISPISWRFAGFRHAFLQRFPVFLGGLALSVAGAILPAALLFLRVHPPRRAQPRVFPRADPTCC